MANILYWGVNAPFYALDKIIKFVVWDIISPRRESRELWPKRYINQDQSAYIQKILKELSAEKRRNDDLHAYYEREQRRREELRRRTDR
jgi:hypothetical protein